MQNVWLAGEEDVEALVAALPRGDTIAEPYALYEKLRPIAPVHGYRDYPPGTVPGADEPVTAWVLLDHDQVSAAARDQRTFSSRDPLQEQSSAPTLMLVNHDNPEHDRLRGIVNLAFSRRRVEELEPWVRGVVDGMVADIGSGEVEVMEALASRIPARIMVGLLGLPEEIADRFRHWATAFMLSVDRGGSVDLHKDWQWISGSSAGCFLDLPIWTAMQGGRSPTGVTVHIGGQIHAATLTGRLSKYV